MDHFDEITVETLQQTLDTVEEKTPTKRLIAAIAYKNGVTQTELAEWYGVERKTIYSWLKRCESESLEQAVRSTPPPGRPSKLTADQQQHLEQSLHDAPTKVGYNAPAWTPALVREYLRESFDAEYTLQSCRRLLTDAGLSYQPPHQHADEPTDAEHEPYHEAFTHSAGRWIPR